MQDIYWSGLSDNKKFIFILGCPHIFNPLVWIIMLIVYFTKDRSDPKYSGLFNPHTLKILYVFGYLTLVLLMIGFLIIIGWFAFTWIRALM